MVALTFPLQFIEDTLNDILAHGPGIDNLIMKELSSRVLILAEVFRHRLFDMLILKETQLEETLQRRYYSDGLLVCLQVLSLHMYVYIV
jgi:hypothetical protein